MKYIPFDKVVEIYNRISGHVPHNKTIRAAQDYALMVLNEVMESQTELNEYDVYRKVQHDFLLEDARNFVADHLECDEDDEQMEKYDYEYLVSEYERREDCNVAFNDTWWSVVEEYMEEQDGWQSIGFYGHDENGNLTHWEA